MDWKQREWVPGAREWSGSRGGGILVASARVWGRREWFYNDGMTVNIKRVLGYNWNP